MQLLIDGVRAGLEPHVAGNLVAILSSVLRLRSAQAIGERSRPAVEENDLDGLENDDSVQQHGHVLDVEQVVLQFLDGIAQ